MRIDERHYAETARDYARRVLKDNIVEMELEPGAMVSENELAAQMGVSRTPVREALMDLAKCRVVDVLPQRGSRIALIDYALVEEARFARLVLETAILDQVCERATPADLAQMRQNVRLQMMTQEPDMGGSFSLMELDNAFHEMLFRIAQKENTFRMLGGMTIHFDRVRTLALNVVKDTKIINDHQLICDAIANRDVDGARELMIKHLSRVKLDEKSIRAACPQFIKD